MNYQTIEIRGPIWNGGKRCIGIDPKKVHPIGVYKIKITYKNKEGERIYPLDYHMRGKEIMSYPHPVYKTKYGMKEFYTIPVDDLPTELSGSDICPEHNAIKLKSGLCPMETV